MKRAWLVRRAFVNVDDESREHQQCRQVMNDVTHGDDPTRDEVVEPDQEAGSEKQHAAEHNQPVVDLLAAIEEADILRLNSVRVRRVLLNTFEPTAISASPFHRDK